MRFYIPESAGVMGTLLIVGLWIAAIAGWVMNIMAIVTLAMENAPITTMFVLRAAGIFFAPLGAILGYF